MSPLQYLDATFQALVWDGDARGDRLGPAAQTCPGACPPRRPVSPLSPLGCDSVVAVVCVSRCVSGRHGREDKGGTSERLRHGAVTSSAWVPGTGSTRRLCELPRRDANVAVCDRRAIGDGEGGGGAKGGAKTAQKAAGRRSKFTRVSIQSPQKPNASKVCRSRAGSRRCMYYRAARSGP